MLYHRPVRHHGTARDDHDAVADHVLLGVVLLGAAFVDDADLAADPAVLVEDGALNDGALTHAQVGDAGPAVGGALGGGLEAVGADHDGVAQRHPLTDLTAHTDDASLGQGAGAHHAAVADQALPEARVA